jgi:hypothetical protein
MGCWVTTRSRSMAVALAPRLGLSEYFTPLSAGRDRRGKGRDEDSTVADMDELPRARCLIAHRRVKGCQCLIEINYGGARSRYSIISEYQPTSKIVDDD